MPDLDWNAIADRFFSVYADTSQADVMRLYETTRAQVSRWKAHKPGGRERKEKLPLKVLARLVEIEGVTWDWIMAGEEPKYRPAPPSRPKKKTRIARPREKDEA